MLRQEGMVAFEGAGGDVALVVAMLQHQLRAPDDNNKCDPKEIVSHGLLLLYLLLRLYLYLYLDYIWGKMLHRMNHI